jgi:HEAT repeat protein
MRTGVLVVTFILVCGCNRSLPTPSGGKPTSYWVDALKHRPETELRKEAAFKLGNIGPSDPSVYPALMEALKDYQAVVRCEAIRALLKLGSIAHEAIPTLVELRDRDRDSKVRICATKALEKLQGK